MTYSGWNNRETWLANLKFFAGSEETWQEMYKDGATLEEVARAMEECLWDNVRTEDVWVNRLIAEHTKKIDFLEIARGMVE